MRTNKNRLKKIEERLNEQMAQLERTPATIIMSPSGKVVLVWSDGQSEDITKAQAEDLRSQGKVAMTIRTVSETGLDLTRRICSGEMPSRGQAEGG